MKQDKQKDIFERSLQDKNYLIIPEKRRQTSTKGTRGSSFNLPLPAGRRSFRQA